jgi:hypothetical protein
VKRRKMSREVRGYRMVAFDCDRRVKLFWAGDRRNDATIAAIEFTTQAPRSLGATVTITRCLETRGRERHTRGEALELVGFLHASEIAPGELVWEIGPT